MRRELYIDGRLADIDGVSIPLNFACSEIADLTGVSGNYSLTVKLPLTGNNIMIAYFANLPNVTPESLWTGYRTTASYFIDGVPIFQNGNVKLLSTEKTIDVSITFGNLSWLDVLENIKLKDVWDEAPQDWNYWSIANQTDFAKWIIADFGGTFDYGLRMDRMHPAVNVIRLWRLIWDKLYSLDVIGSDVYKLYPIIDSDLWLPIMSQILNPALRTGADFTNPTTFFMTDMAFQAVTKLGFSLFAHTETTPGLVFEQDLPHPTLINDKYFIIPKDGNYKITSRTNIIVDFGESPKGYTNIQLKLTLKKSSMDPQDGQLVYEYNSGVGTHHLDQQTLAAYGNGTFKFNKGDVIYMEIYVQQSQDADASISTYIEAQSNIFSIEYVVSTEKKEQVEFLMKFDIGYNLPDISCKDFVKSMMQLHGLLVENNSSPINNIPQFFNLNDLKASDAEDWSNKLVSFKTPKIEWNLGLKQKNYMKYVSDSEDTVIADSYFETYENDLSEKDLFTSIYAASEDSYLVGTSYFDLPVCSVPLWVVDEKEGYKYTGKIKQRLFRAYGGNVFNVAVVQLYGEDYTPINIDEEDTPVSWFKLYPVGLTNIGQSLDWESIMKRFYGAFITSVKSNRLFTNQILLNEIDINKFSHRKLVYLEKFANYYFIKKILNWEARKVCNVEMLQMIISGQNTVFPSTVRINKTFSDSGDYDQIFLITLTGDNGFVYADLELKYGIGISLSDLPPGTYTVTEGVVSNFTMISKTPDVFTLDADNMHETIEIVNEIVPYTAPGTVVVTKVITGVETDETYFDVTITGLDGEFIRQTGQVRLGDPLVFEDLPIGSYVINEGTYDEDTETWVMVDGYELSYIDSALIYLTEETPTAEVTITNELSITPNSQEALYNWFALDGIAPAGWHVPTMEDWITLTMELDNDFNPYDPDYDQTSLVAGGKIKIVDSLFWDTPNVGATNSSNFSAIGSGARDNGGNYTNKKITAIFWTSDGGITVTQLYVDSTIFEVVNFYANPQFGYSIRLLKDSTDKTNGETGTFTDYDGNTYPTICIGSEGNEQEWMQTNLFVEHLADGTPIPMITDNTEWAAKTSLAMCFFNNEIP